jgi:hypothetical protein
VEYNYLSTFKEFFLKDDCAIYHYHNLIPFCQHILANESFLRPPKLVGSPRDYVSSLAIVTGWQLACSGTRSGMIWLVGVRDTFHGTVNAHLRRRKSIILLRAILRRCSVCTLHIGKKQSYPQYMQVLSSTVESHYYDCCTDDGTIPEIMDIYIYICVCVCVRERERERMYVCEKGKGKAIPAIGV